MSKADLINDFCCWVIAQCQSSFPSPMSQAWVFSACIAILIASLFRVFQRSTSWIKFPPGPKPLPLFGNAFQLPSERQEEEYADWAKIYGDIMHVHVLDHHIVILSSIKAARDLLEGRGSIYSDRPRFVLLSEMMGWEHASTHVRYGPRFRKHRRFINQVFNQKAVVSFRPLQEKEILILLDGLLHDPDRFVDHFRRFAAAVILKITYGHDILSVNDLFIRLAERAGSLTVEAGSPAANWVDFFPVLRHIPTWVPFSAFKIRAIETKKAVTAMMEIPFAQVKDTMRSGTAVPSYTSLLLDSHRGQNGAVVPEDEEDIKSSAGTLFTAAEDTTIASIHTFILILVLHPHIMKKAQEEIDSIIGPETRLLNIDDRPSLPYFECVLKEALRWSPMVPMGMPHRLMEDDFYRGFYLPTGTTVVANIYAILRDCPDPDRFYPERYLDDPTLLNPFDVIFGFGRRACPGRHLAESNIFLMAANLVAAFDVSKRFDGNGNDVNSSYEFLHGFVRHPKPFMCTIKPRSAHLASLIDNARAAAGPHS